ncbi:MAG: FAD-binding oxidoreductase [Candidatus Bathyarchaeota archaeon]
MKDTANVNPQDIVRLLVEIVGKDNVLHESYDLVAYSRDRYPILTHPKLGVKPVAVVRPATTDEVRKIVLLANKHRIPLTPRGSGTNYAGSAVPVKGGVVLDLTRMNKILNINEDSMSAKVQAGVILQKLEEALNDKGFTFGHDPGSFPTATVGGCISTRSLGWRAGKYGDMGRLVVALTVVLPTGVVVETREVPTSSTGFDVNSLFIGAEGTLGVITEAVLRIHPFPEERVFLRYSFNSFEQAFKSLLKVLRNGLNPTSSFVEDYEDKQEAELFLYYEGVKEIVEAQVKRVVSILDTEGGTKLDDKVAKEYWANRHDMFSQMNMEGVADSIEPAVPANKTLEFYKFLKEWIKRSGVKVIGMSSWVYPENLGMDIAFDETKAEEYAAARDELANKALELGGTVSYCVGVGLRFQHLMRKEHGSALDLMKTIKRAMDPNNIMNPGGLGL